ncbi:MAG: ArsR family transcriptional regulator [Planctomycetes bacterium]|jgi:ArsR family transcriptional regulator|nr:ArsR family transcriptional regulator [Planctomycetota bacterium]
MYICIMVQVRKRRTMTPVQASACCRPIDDLLDPELFKALSDPTRSRLLGCLVKCGCACTVSDVGECCAVDLSVVSRHLSLLERAGVVQSSKTGRTVHYVVDYAHLCRTMRAIADAIEQCCPAEQLPGCARGCCGAR